MREPNELVVTKVFDAPVEKVWSAWTTPELIARWFEPSGTMEVRELDMSVGGKLRFADPNDTESGEYTGTFTNVEPTKEFSFEVMDYSMDPAGIPAGFKVAFEESSQQTTMTLTSIPPENSYDKQTFDAWTGCFERLAKAIQ